MLYGNQLGFRHVALPPRLATPFMFDLKVPPQRLGLPKSAFGDVDALLAPVGAPWLAHAVEYKRILMPARTFQTLSPNKLQELAKGIAQANQLAEVGFAFVWFSVLVLVDSRELTAPTGGYLAAPRQLMDRVYESLPLGNCHARVGVIVHELTQCFDRPITQSGMIGGRLIRDAQQGNQPAHLTEGITAAFAA